MIKSRKPKIENLSEKDKRLYEFGILLLGSFVCEEFIDLPPLPEGKYDVDGLFYTIPYFDDNTLWSSGNSRTVLVVYRIENNSSYCPLRIEVEVKDEQNFNIFVYEQGEKTIKKSLISKNNGEYYTEINEHDTVRLSELIKEL